MPTTPTGILALPHNILLHIVNYIPRLPNPLIAKDEYIHFLERPLPVNEPRLLRTRTLLAISGTCRALRSFALPVAWESIEVLACKVSNWEPRLLEELYSKLDFVTVQKPDFAKYVKNVSVLLTDTPVQVFSACIAKLASLPNLESLNIAGEGFFEVNLTQALAPYTFPTIRQLVIPDLGRAFMARCPNLEVLHVLMDQEEPGCFEPAKAMVKDLFRHCRRLRKVEGLPFIWKKDLSKMLASFPDLTDIHLNSFGFYTTFPTSETISKLAGFPNLRNITYNSYNNALKIEEVDYDPNSDRAVSLLAGIQPLLPWCTSPPEEEPVDPLLEYMGFAPPNRETMGAFDDGLSEAEFQEKYNLVYGVEYQGARTVLVNLVGSERDLYARIIIENVDDGTDSGSEEGSCRPNFRTRRQVGHRVPGKFKEMCCSIEVEDFGAIDEEMLSVFDHEQLLTSPGSDDEDE